MKENRDKTIAVTLANWVETLSISEVPDAVCHAAKRCIIDTFGVMVAGSQMQVAKRINAHVVREYGKGSCTVLGAGCRISAIGAALANGTSAHCLDFDDISYAAGPVHASAVVLPAVLAACESSGGSGGRLLEAFVAGVEAEYAFSLALTNSHYLSGWWATGTLGAIGAALGAAKALNYPAKEVASAIAFAAIQANGMTAMLGFDAKPILAGQAARLGLEAALLAAQGNSVPEHAFEDKRGFVKLMNGGRFNQGPLSELSKVWRLLEPGIAVKHAPVCSAAQAAIEITKSLIEQNGIDQAQVSQVRCEVPHLVKISMVHECPANPSEAQFSMPFAIGCILAFGALGPEHISDEVLTNNGLKSAMAKVEMLEADDLNGAEFQPRFPECARITIETVDGDSFSGFLGASTGTSENPASDDDISNKFHNCVAFSGWTREKGESVLDGLWKIETASDMSLLLNGGT